MAQTHGDKEGATAGLPSGAALTACEIVALRARELVEDARCKPKTELRDATGPIDTASARRPSR